MKSLIFQAALLIAIAGAGLTAQDVRTISGRVVRADSKEPISGVQVTLNGLASSTRLTDAQGRFQFDVPASTNHVLHATRPGYFGLNENGETSAAYSVPINVAQASDLVISMIPGSVIAGRVQDSNGRPAVNADVAALRFIEERGNRILRSSSVGSPRTDDQGKFRLSWLPPGEYVIAAQVRAGDIPGSVGQLFFYPAATHASGSTRVSIGAGEERTVDLVIPPPERWGASISGRIVDSRTPSEPQRVTSVTVYLQRSDALLPRDGMTPAANIPNLQVPPGGSVPFEIKGLSDGVYEILVHSQGAPVGGGTRVDVHGPQEGVTVSLHLDHEVKGKILLNGQPFNSRSVQVSLQAIGGFTKFVSPSLQNVYGRAARVTQVAEDGSFVIRDVAEGDFKFQFVFNNRPDLYVADIRQGDASILSSGIHVSELPPIPVEVILGIR